jgi:hypothetical protein
MRTSECLSFSIAILLILSNDCYSQSPKDRLTAKDVVAALSDKLTSIDSLYCEYEQKYTPTDGSSPITETSRYARHGEKWHKTEGFQSEKELTVCFDGTKSYSFVRKAVRKYQSEIEVRDSHARPLVSPEFLIGVHVPGNLKGSITDFCSVHDFDLMPQAADARHCQLILRDIPLDYAKKDDLVGHDLACTLDPDHDMLPVSIQVEFSPDSKDRYPTHRNWFQRWRITRFERVLDERVNAERWFPTSGILEQGNTEAGPQFEIRMTRVRINANLDESLFNPHVTAATQNVAP